MQRSARTCSKYKMLLTHNADKYLEEIIIVCKRIRGESDWVLTAKTWRDYSMLPRKSP